VNRDLVGAPREREDLKVQFIFIKRGKVFEIEELQCERLEFAESFNEFLEASKMQERFVGDDVLEVELPVGSKDFDEEIVEASKVRLDEERIFAVEIREEIEEEALQAEDVVLVREVVGKEEAWENVKKENPVIFSNFKDMTK